MLRALSVWVAPARAEVRIYRLKSGYFDLVSIILRQKIFITLFLPLNLESQGLQINYSDFKFIK